ncbi:MAG: site-specific DNA-methyltransferase [Alphaproteobacteria bacterium]|nr:site-specific DNA-methyltransferase [Alphaproteobacteria bacterium]
MVQELDIKKLDGKSLDIAEADKEKLKAVFPQCFVEGKLDIDKLLSLCGEYIDNDFEKYKFEWKGKSECLRIAGKRSTGTLRPCPEESVDFENTNNLYIEGDNLEVLKLLQTAYYRKVKMIYIDPPYNTGNDFVYEDDFKDPLAKYKEITSQTTKSNPETMGRYHTNWLNMMYPRLRLAANLLRDDGVIFISIDDNEVTNLRRLCDEVFGEENFVAQIVWQKKYAATNDSKGFSTTHDYIVVYQKSESFNRNLLPRTEEQNKPYKNDDGDGKGLWRSDNLLVKSFSESGVYPIVNPNTGESFMPPKGSCWRASQETMKLWLRENRIYFGKDGKGAPQLKRYLNEVQQGRVPITWWPFEEVGHNDAANKEVQALFGGKAPFDTPKPTTLIEQMIRIGSAKNDIILDFFSGSATTAHAVMQLNAEDGGKRQFIMVQLPEVTDEKSEAFKAGYKNICEIGKERIRRAGAKIKEQNADVDVGFKVLKLDTSNLVKWDDTPLASTDTADLFNRMDGMIESIKKGRSELDVVYEVMLKLGIPATYQVFENNLNGRKVYSIGDDGLILICLDGSNGGITPEDITAMCELAPAKIVAAEEAFKDDVALSNAFYISKDSGVEIMLL